jgi:hypothetical protein
MNYWCQNGYLSDGSHKPAGWLQIDPTNVAEVKCAGWLFRGFGICAGLPDAWVNPMPSTSGFTWDVAGDPDPDNGHGFTGCGYNADGSVPICTWGMLGTLTAPALAKYAAESSDGMLIIVVSQDDLVAGKQQTADGIAWGALEADFQAIGGAIQAPTGKSCWLKRLLNRF